MASRRQQGPSAFSDSPEDLLRKAELWLGGESQVDLPRDLVVLLTDICRALEKERSDRAYSTGLISDAYEAQRRAEDESARRGRLLAHPLRLAASHLAERLRQRLPRGLAALVPEVRAEVYYD